MEELYTAEEVRVALKVKMPTIRSWIHQGRLLVIRTGRSVRIRESVPPTNSSQSDTLLSITCF